MTEGTGRLELPQDLARFCKGLKDIQQDFITGITGTAGSIIPEEWTGLGETPVICDFKPEVDLSAAREMYSRFLELLVEHKPVWTEDAARLLAISAEDFTCLMSFAQAGEREAVERILHRLEVKPEVAWFTVSHTLKPFLRLFAEAVKPSIDSDNWLRNFCPVCGNKANQARVDNVEGKRYLLCSQCETEWLFKLLACPWCGNEDHRRLAFLEIEETPGYSLHVCENCKGYIKAVDERKGGDSELLKDETATLYLDILAQQRGYSSDVTGA